MQFVLWKYVSRISSSFLSGIVLGLPIYVTINDYFFSIARVEGTSMQPTLNPSGSKTTDLVFLDRWHVTPDDIACGDIVALTAPNDHRVSFIKRVVGLEGDIVNTPRYKHSYALIPRGHCWVEGDNTKSSLDSNKFGPVSMGLIKGKATYIVWPPKRWCKLNQSDAEEDWKPPAAHIDRVVRKWSNSEEKKARTLEVEVEVDKIIKSDFEKELEDVSYTVDAEGSTLDTSDE